LFRKTNRADALAIAMSLLVIVGVGWAQDDSGSPAQDGLPPAEVGQQPNSAPPSTQTNQPSAHELNPPIVGIDVPALQPPGAETRSFLIPGAQISQSVDANEGNPGSGSSINGVSRGWGTLSLEKLWRRYQLALDYLGGAAYYSNRPVGLSSLQLLDVDQHILWSRGQFAIRDSFSYLPEGNFGAGSFGGSGALGSIGGLAGGLAGLGILGPGQFASFGDQPRITNVTIADVTQFLTPRSSISGVGSYGFVHFTGDNNNIGLINSHQIVGEAAYDYLLNRRDQIAILYAYQAFRYPSLTGNTVPPANFIGSSFSTNLVNVLFGRRISGRMEFVAGGGPQFIHIDSSELGSENRVTFSGRASLRYQIKKSQLALTFFRYNTNGSGIFAGATTNVVRFVVSHPLSERWVANVDVGYSHNSRILTLPGQTAQSFGYVYAGGSLYRQLGRQLSGFVSFQFSNVNPNGSLCMTGFSCSYTSQREVGLIGLDWHPHPIRID